MDTLLCFYVHVLYCSMTHVVLLYVAHIVNNMAFVQSKITASSDYFTQMMSYSYEVDLLLDRLLPGL